MNTNSSNGTSANESEAKRLYTEYLARCRAGEKVNPSEYFRQYPHLKENLRKIFDQTGTGSTEEIELVPEDGRAPGQEAGQRILGDFKVIREIGDRDQCL